MLAQDARPSLPVSGVAKWQHWLSSSVDRLEGANLLRALHPVTMTLSPVEVIDQRTRACWDEQQLPIWK